MEHRISIRPINPSIGAVITGVHVRDLTDLEIASIKQEVMNRCMVVLPDQGMTGRELERFGARFGEIFIPGRPPTVDGTRCVTELINNLTYDDPEYRTNHWHTDAPHMERPPSFTFLSCVEPAPDGGGDTMWSNQYLAYETLPDDIKRKIRGLQVTFRIADYYQKHSPADTPAVRSHPLVRVHPQTGRKCTYVDGLVSTVRIEGPPADEAEALRAYLYQHAQTPEHCCRHRWSRGDLVIWDNRCAMHYAVADYAPTDTRTLMRLLVAGEAPISESQWEEASLARAS